MNIPKLPETLELKQIQALRKAFGHFYDQENGSRFVDKSTGYSFSNVTDFVDYLYSPEIGIPKGTSAKHIGITLESWYETRTKTPEIGETTMTPIPKVGAESNTLTPEQLKQFEEEAEERTASQKKAEENAKRSVEQSIKRRKEIREKIKGKKIIISPKDKFSQVTLTLDEKKRIYNLAQSVKADPSTFQKIVEQKIQESVNRSSSDIRQNISEKIIKQTAKDLASKLKPFTEYKNPKDIPDSFVVYNQASPFVALSNPENALLKGIISDDEVRKTLAQNAMAVAISLEAENSVEYALTEPLFEGNENISSLFYQRQVAEFQIAENQDSQDNKDESMELDIESVYDQGEKIWDVWQKLANKETTVEEILSASSNFSSAVVETPVVTESVFFINKAVPSTVGVVFSLNATNTIAVGALSSSALALPGQQITQMVVGGGARQLVQTSALMMGTVDKFFFNAIFPATKTAMFVGSGFTIGGEKMLAVGLKIGSSKLAIALSSKGISVAATGFFGKALTALGSLGGPIGIAVGAVLGVVLGKIIEKIDWSKVKKAIPYILGLVVGAPVLLIVGPVAGVAAGFVTFGVASGGASIGGAGLAIGLLLKRFGKGFFSVAIKPFLIFFLIAPVVIVIVLFIINSGAYIVPPTGSTVNSVNPYIDVKKTATPTGPFENTDLPLVVTYNVIISAKKGPLTNLSLRDTCQAITRNGNIDCPTNTPSDIPDQISPSVPYSYSYDVDYPDGQYEDSLIINTLTVTADTTDGIKDTITSASIKVGDPPDSCPNDSWPIAGSVGLNSVTQGPSAPACSHENLGNAIDIGVDGEIIVAVHSGIVTVGEDSCVGKYIKITSVCGSTPFSTLYAHLGAVTVRNGQSVTLGQTLGITDNTGTCTSGPHLHFEFQTSSIPIVQKPYLIRNIPSRCCTRMSCNP